MGFDNWLHIAEILVIGVPVWYGAVHFFFVIREYPPHLHDSDDKLRIKYPKGYEPTQYRKDN